MVGIQNNVLPYFVLLQICTGKVGVRMAMIYMYFTEGYTIHVLCVILQTAKWGTTGKNAHRNVDIV
jgi:hypothetical protein